MPRPRSLGLAAVAWALLVPALQAGCSLERRNDVDVEAAEGEVPDEGVELEVPPVADPVASARATVEVFREAVRVGDLALALSLLERDAVLLDALADETEEPATRGELLVGIRRQHSEGLRLEIDSMEVLAFEEAALVVSRLRVLRPDPEAEDELREEGEAVETVVLRWTADGWRILHVHRSVRPHP